MVVLGGGGVGVELAEAVARFGVEVTGWRRWIGWCRADEPEAGRLLAEIFERECAAVRTAAPVTEACCDGARLDVDLEGGTSLAAGPAAGRHQARR